MIQTGYEFSGNILNFKAANFLRKNGWSVIESAYFSDDYTDKPREIDIIATKYGELWQYWESNEPKYIQVNIRLFIECKFLTSTSEYGFWLSDQNTTETKKLIGSRHASFIGSNFNPENWSKKHHYLQAPFVVKAHDRKATTNNERGVKQKNSEFDLIFDAISKVLNSHAYFHNKQIDPNIKIQPRTTVHTVDYLVVVVDDCNAKMQLLTLDDSFHPKCESVQKQFIYEVNYAYPSLQERYGRCLEYSLLDFVSFESLQDYLAVITQDQQFFRSVLENMY